MFLYNYRSDFFWENLTRIRMEENYSLGKPSNLTIESSLVFPASSWGFVVFRAYSGSP